MEYLLTFQNTHYAVHSEKVLLNKKISVSVMALPTSLGDFCGICLRITRDDLDIGRAFLAEAKIPIKGIFEIEEICKERKYLPWKP